MLPGRGGAQHLPRYEGRETFARPRQKPCYAYRRGDGGDRKRQRKVVRSDFVSAARFPEVRNGCRSIAPPARESYSAL